MTHLARLRSDLRECSLAVEQPLADWQADSPRLQSEHFIEAAIRRAPVFTGVSRFSGGYSVRPRSANRGLRPQ
jgi:hypothetical protein